MRAKKAPNLYDANGELFFQDDISTNTGSVAILFISPETCSNIIAKLSCVCFLWGTQYTKGAMLRSCYGQNTLQGRARAERARFGRNRVFTILATLVSLWLGMQRLCAWLLLCLHVCGSVLSVRMHMHLIMLSLCQSVSVSLCRGQLSACWQLMKTNRCQKALWEKNMVRGSPTSPDLNGFSEECSHKFV